MKSTRSVALLLTGAVLGASLTTPAARAVATFVQAQRTPHPIYVDGQQVQMETYAIGGHNYVKLRDIGQAVGFEVYWDGSAARILSDQPYTGSPPAEGLNSALAASDIFTPELTEEMYQGLRSALLHQDEAAAGTYAPTSLGIMSGERYGELVKGFKTVDILESISYEYSYATSQQRDGMVLCTVSVFEPAKAAIEQVKPFLSGLSGATQWEQVEKIVWYICDHLTYNANSTSGPSSESFVDGTVIEGRCETYAEWMKLLCEQAGIPCIILRSDDHSWNSVYVDGAWWDVDACWDDENERMEGIPARVEAHRRQETIFHAPNGWTDEHHKPCNPESALFTKELLVPGSTK